MFSFSFLTMGLYFIIQIVLIRYVELSRETVFLIFSIWQMAYQVALVVFYKELPPRFSLFPAKKREFQPDITTSSNYWFKIDYTNVFMNFILSTNVFSMTRRDIVPIEYFLWCVTLMFLAYLIIGEREILFRLDNFLSTGSDTDFKHNIPFSLLPLPQNAQEKPTRKNEIAQWLFIGIVSLGGIILGVYYFAHSYTLVAFVFAGFALYLTHGRMFFIIRSLRMYSAPNFSEKTDARNNVMEMKRFCILSVYMAIVLYLCAAAMFIKYPFTELFSGSRW